MKFCDFWVVGWKFTKFLMSHLNLQVSFSWNFTSLFSIKRDNSSVLFLAENFDKRSPSKCQISDFWFHQILTFIGSFGRKFTKFQLKKYRGVASHDIEDWWKIWRKTDSCFKTDKNLVKFDLSSLKSQICTLRFVLSVKSMQYLI